MPSPPRSPAPTTTTITTNRLSRLQNTLWAGSLALEIRLAASDCRTYDTSTPYLIQYPRLSYLAFLLPRLHAFFAPALINPDTPSHEAWLEVENVPLKWQWPCGLLFDVFSGGADQQQQQRRDEGEGGSRREVGMAAAEPWRLTIHYSDFPFEQLIQLDGEERCLRDSFVNAVKEADFIRNGSARTVMFLSMEDSDKLWRAVRTHDLALFDTINTKLLHPPGLELRHVPLKIYLPTSSTTAALASEPIPEETQTQAGHIRVVQALVPLYLPQPPPSTSTKQPQTLGTALNTLLPTIFPSRRNPLLAQPVLHGAAVPMGALLGELGAAAAYPDGFLHVVVVMLG